LKTLDWYIIKKFLITFFFAIFLLSAIAIVIDITEKIDDFIGNHAPLRACCCRLLPEFYSLDWPDA
jgi:lipopolysaccharide export system permease protein